MNRFVLFFLVLFVAMGLMGWYVHRRTSRVFGLGRRARVALAIVIVVGIATFAGRRLIGVDDMWLRDLAIVGSGISLSVVLATGLLLHVDLARGLWWVGERVFGLKRRGAESGRELERFSEKVPTDAELAAGGATEVGALAVAEGAASLGAASIVGASAPGDNESTPNIDAGAASDASATSAAESEREPMFAPAKARSGDTSDDLTHGVGRRAFVRYASAGAIVTGTAGSFYGALFGRRDYTIDEVSVVLRGLPRALDGLTIVQLSDIHVGSFIGEGELRAATSLVRQARPDLIVLTGDLLDHDPSYAPVLGRWVEAMQPLARFGVAAIPGNHDHYAGVEAVEEALVRAGAHLMTNAGRLIGDGGGAFALLGVDDVWAHRSSDGRRPDLARALAMVPADVPKVLLAHQPVFMEEAAGKVDLQLSGHTHGGQVTLGWNPAELVLPNGWVRGRYDVGESVLYVNRGFGTAGPPVRLFSPPEVTKLVLVAG